MKTISDTLFSLAALAAVVISLFGALLESAKNIGGSDAGDQTQIPAHEHRFEMHGYDAPVHDKKAITTKEQTAKEQEYTEQASTGQQDSAERTTDTASTEQDTYAPITAEAVSTEQDSDDRITAEAASTEQDSDDRITAEAVSTEEPADSPALSFEYASTGSLLAEVNSMRASYGLSPLADDSLLDAAAAARAAELTVCMSHTRPDGRPASSIVTDYGIPCSYRGENIAAGYSLSSSVLAGWEESPSHLENLLNPVFTRAGISHTVTSSGYLDYWVILLSD